MMDQASADESFQLIVWSLGRRCRWRGRAMGWTLSARVRRTAAGLVGLACIAVTSGAMRSFVATIESGLAGLGR